MGNLRDITNQSNVQTFPGATFQANGDIPAAQCTDALVKGDSAITRGFPPNDLTDVGAFQHFNLIGKTCHITASVGGTPGDYLIINNNNDVLFLGGNPGAGNPVTYHVTDGGALLVTYDIQEFATLISAAGYSTTIKGGQLYTNMPSNLLDDFCAVLFDPQT